ncbi:putative replication initiation protein [Rakkovirus canuewis]|uniref:Putative replication initiation protein n=1 Tax=Littorina sp. associated circular virus TaxID=1692253 RepID=A0A0K1RLM4_9CIRC|nr:putative replication initiation protein [Littorina sp. associated circular virus]AKV62262.1 putative replication initiation protein [Littorina sp. associated circular virus]
MPAKRVYQGKRGKRWCFTLNNYTEAEKDVVVAGLIGKEPVFAKVGAEVGDSGTPHLQGFVHLKERESLGGVKKILGNRCHLEMARGTDIENDEYVSKGSIVVELGAPVEGATEKGGGDTGYIMARAAAQQLADGGDLCAIAEDPELWKSYCQHGRAIEKLAEATRKSKQHQLAADSLGDPILQAWQRTLLRHVLGEPDMRKIHWMYDLVGNMGKTWMSKYLCAKHGAVRFENGKSADIKYAYNGERIVIFDLSRSQEDHFNYEVLESVKNGIMFSPKFDSKMKVFAVPHVLVFANWGPEESKLSRDRWDVKCMTDQDMEWSDLASNVIVKQEGHNVLIDMTGDREADTQVMDWNSTDDSDCFIVQY